MIKFAGILAVAVGLALIPSPQKQQELERAACVQQCFAPLDPELHRQEIVSLEKEAAHAIQLNNTSYFRRVYSDDFTGILSHGQLVSKAEWIALIGSPEVRYESFNTSDVKVQLYENMAVATCLWSSRRLVNGQRISHQLRTIHIYLNGASGWHVVTAQTTSMPPDVGQPL
jgi:hypothetical protein